MVEVMLLQRLMTMLMLRLLMLMTMMMLRLLMLMMPMTMTSLPMTARKGRVVRIPRRLEGILEIRHWVACSRHFASPSVPGRHRLHPQSWSHRPSECVHWCEAKGIQRELMFPAAEARLHYRAGPAGRILPDARPVTQRWHCWYCSRRRESCQSKVTAGHLPAGVGPPGVRRVHRARTHVSMLDDM